MDTLHVGNHYAGYTVGPGDCIDRVDSSISPLEFWQKYIVARKPVVLSCLPPDMAGLNALTDEYLLQKAGEVVVTVEVKHEGAYGKGRKVHVKVAELLERMRQGDSDLYLTPQQGSRGGVRGELVESLRGALPLRPALFGQLVPWQVNLWLGQAPDGASSGLHHDFHDNLYVLLRGRKRFCLYSPDQVERMYMSGKVKTVFHNGRIVYQGQENVRSDGADEEEVRAWQHRQAAQQAMAAAEQAAFKGEQNAEQLLEAALASVLDGLPDFSDDFDADEDVAPQAAREVIAEAGLPDNFSQVNTALPEGTLRQDFPLFPGASACCEVRAGETLFLPAGWIHEVTSYGGRESNGHLAVNYWAYPPDNLLPTMEGFLQPYRCGFWQDWHFASSRQPIDDHGSPPSAANPAAEVGSMVGDDGVLACKCSLSAAAPQTLHATKLNKSHSCKGKGSFVRVSTLGVRKQIAACAVLTGRRRHQLCFK